LPRLFSGREPAASALTIGAGALIFLIPGMPAPPDPVGNPRPWEWASEVCVVIGLFGVGLRIDSRNLFVPDVMVACGAPPEPDAMELLEPIIVVEVLSPSTSAIDMIRKLDAYLRHPTVRHYLLIDIDRRMVVHHAKAEDGRIATALLRDGSLALDPPGLTVEVAALFARL